MSGYVFRRQGYLFLVYIYIILSFMNEVVWITSFINIIPLLKYAIIVLLILNIIINFVLEMKINRQYLFSLLFLVTIQLVNIILGLFSYDSLGIIGTSLSYILVIWMFFLHIIEIDTKIKIEFIKKIYFSLSLLLIISILYTYYTGSYLTSNIGGRLRYLFGFSNVNRLGSMIFLLFNMGMFCLQDTIIKRKKVFYILSLIFLIGILLLTDSRTPLSILTIQIIMIGIMKLGLLRKINYYYLIAMSVIILFYIIKSNSLSSKTFHLIDYSLSGRLSNWSNIISNMKGYEYIFGITNENTYNLISNYYSSYKTGIYIDNFYIYYFFNNGLLGLTLLLVYLSSIFKMLREHSLNNCKRILTIVFLGSLIYSFFEGWIISINNITSILFWILLSTMIVFRTSKS